MKIALVAFLCCASLPAQWINYPTAGIPRTPDGKPNLSAPAPRTPDGKPDLTGLWGTISGPYQGNVGADLKPEDIKLWADNLVKQRQANFGRDNPAENGGCLPFGPHAMLADPWMKQFIQTPTRLVILVEEVSFRQVLLDGRPLPKDPDPQFYGYSVGHWEGDTLVVESSGFKDSIWLDGAGHPITPTLKITERFHRRDFGHMDITTTFDDPAVFNRKFTINTRADFIPDTEILEYVCQENERDRQHLTGKRDEYRIPTAVKVAPEVLAQYVGTYKFAYPETPTVFSDEHITMKEGELYMDFEGGNQAPLVPVSDTAFYRGTERIEFVKDAAGKVICLTRSFAEGDLIAIRVSGR